MSKEQFSSEFKSNAFEEEEVKIEQLTETQLNDLADYFGVSVEHKTPQEIEEEIDQRAEHFFDSEKGEELKQKIEEKVPGIFSWLRQKKWLKVALVMIPLITVELSAGTVGLEGQNKIEQKEQEEFYFDNFLQMWEEWQAKRKENRETWKESDWEDVAKKEIALQQEMERMFKYIAENEDFQKSPSYRAFLKQYPDGFAFEEKKFLMFKADLSGERLFPPEAPVAYETEVSGDGYSIVCWVRKNIEAQEGGVLYHVPEVRNYMVKLDNNEIDVFIGNWDYEPQGRTRK